MNPQHTPGPWSVAVDLDGRECVVSEPDRVFLVRHDVWAEGMRQEMEANARLIAAAPELLEALEWLGDHCPDPGDKGFGEWFEEFKAVARVAIAKATA